ncbi:MAG: L-threonylcarbamoyladenylate synthase [Pseudomonadales bacterium]|nr:L-threonylcarbamoyladenylate synthase [Pseudomonadales bacterium]
MPAGTGPACTAGGWHITVAVRVLRSGGIVLHATEGVWGLACDPFNARAVTRLLAIKRRPVNKGLILIGSTADCFEPELLLVDPASRTRIEATWPGAVTWILPQQRFPAWITGEHETVAVRVPGHPQARALAAGFGGPLVSTSANAGGQKPAGNRWQALRFASRSEPAVDYMLPGEVLGLRGPSAIRTPEGATLRESAGAVRH